MCPGSTVNQEVVKMAAAGAAEILRRQVVKETVAEVVVILAKRQKYTLTRLPDIGQHILNESVPGSVWFEENLAGTTFCLTFGFHGLQNLFELCNSHHYCQLRSVLIVCCICIVFRLHKATAVSPHL